MRYFMAITGIALSVAACRQHHQELVLYEPAAKIVQPMANPLDEYERMLEKTRELERENSRMRANLDDLAAENSALYAQLAHEQRRRHEAELKLLNAQAEIEAAVAARKTIDNLRTALDHVKAELAAAHSEIRTRREELAKVVLEQQQWNRYVLERLQARGER